MVSIASKRRRSHDVSTMTSAARDCGESFLGEDQHVLNVSGRKQTRNNHSLVDVEPMSHEDTLAHALDHFRWTTEREKVKNDAFEKYLLEAALDE